MASMLVTSSTCDPNDVGNKSWSIPWLLTLTMLAGMLSALIIQAIDPVFQMPSDIGPWPFQPSQEYLDRYYAASSWMISRNYAVYFSVLGAFVGLTLGTVGSKHIRFVSIIGAASGGAGLGGIGGYLVGLMTSALLQHGGEPINLLGVSVEPIVQTAGLQCLAWSFVGLGIGVGWSAGQWRSGTIAQVIGSGLIGGIAAGLVYTLISAIVFSDSNAVMIVPRTVMERILWSCACSACVGVGFQRLSLRAPKLQ